MPFPAPDETLRGASKGPLDPPPRLLLGPGPANCHPRVLSAQALPLVGHLDPAFVALMNETQELMRYTYQTRNAVTFPVSGTGSAAMEACFANAVRPGDVVLVCVAGYFGLRMKDMASRYGGEIRTLEREWGEVFTVDEVRAGIAEHKPAVLCVVHADTSTGARQDGMEEIGAAAAAAGALLIVDTVTSLAAEPVLVDKWGPHCLVYSGAQKCVGAPPGISPLTVGDKAMERIRARDTVHNWYLDLQLITRYWAGGSGGSGGGGGRSYHHTAPISGIYGMHAALKLIAEEGLAARWARHREHAELLWSQLESIGLELVVAPESRLSALTTVRVPDGIDAKAVQVFLLKNYNIEIGGGLGKFAGNAWRIGLMGHNSRRENVILVVTALKEAMDAQRK